MFTHIAKIVPRAIKKYGITRQARAALICAKYRKLAPQILPPEIFIHTWPKHFRNRTLVIGVDHPIFAEQISHQKHKLQELINQSLGKNSLKNIQTKVEEKLLD